MDREFYALQIWLATLFSDFESLESFGGLKVIMEVWIVKILAKIKRKELGNQQSKV